jgi:hypothetical protein
MFCTNCGQQIENGIRFCSLCGAKQVTDEAGFAPTLPVTPQMLQAAPPVSAPVPAAVPVAVPAPVPVAAPAFTAPPMAAAPVRSASPPPMEFAQHAGTKSSGFPVAAMGGIGAVLVAVLAGAGYWGWTTMQKKDAAGQAPVALSQPSSPAAAPAAMPVAMQTQGETVSQGQPIAAAMPGAAPVMDGTSDDPQADRQALAALDQAIAQEEAAAKGRAMQTSGKR